MFFQLISALAVLAASVWSMIAGPTVPVRIALGIAAVMTLVSFFLNIRRFRKMKTEESRDGRDEA
jgi:membrane protein implicated in regulation of membrane protease activity